MAGENDNNIPCSRGYSDLHSINRGFQMKDDGFQEMCRRQAMAGGEKASQWAQAYALLEVAHKLSALSALNYLAGGGAGGGYVYPPGNISGGGGGGGPGYSGNTSGGAGSSG